MERIGLVADQVKGKIKRLEQIMFSEPWFCILLPRDVCMFAEPVRQERFTIGTPDPSTASGLG